jgi:MOSC domain-containing protein YiiM
MTTHGFADLPRDTQIMRSLVREAGGSLGVYASVETPGNIRVGDEVRVLG